jgi:protein-S-isoprenylcysteine O-methyltransferase Ste14
LVCHGSFLIAVATMATALFVGMQSGLGNLSGFWAVAADAVLIVQFPLLHSWLLGSGRRVLVRLLPGGLGRTLATTIFATVSSLQLSALFALWTPSGVVWWTPTGAAAVVANAAFVASWVFLVRAIFDAGVGLQTGSIGWLALLVGRQPRFGPMPTRGLFRSCRQPIYLGFFLILWTAPAWTPDHLLLALAWSPYCLLGPRRKERRFRAAYGDLFAEYSERVPYFIPQLLRIHK